MKDFDATFTDMSNFYLEITSGTALPVFDIFSILQIQNPDIILRTYFSIFIKGKHVAHYAWRLMWQPQQRYNWVARGIDNLPKNVKTKPWRDHWLNCVNIAKFRNLIPSQDFFCYCIFEEILIKFILNVNLCQNTSEKDKKQVPTHI